MPNQLKFTVLYYRTDFKACKTKQTKKMVDFMMASIGSRVELRRAINPGRASMEKNYITHLKEPRWIFAILLPYGAGRASQPTTQYGKSGFWDEQDGADVDEGNTTTAIETVPFSSNLLQGIKTEN